LVGSLIEHLKKYHDSLKGTGSRLIVNIRLFSLLQKNNMTTVDGWFSRSGGLAIVNEESE